MLHQPDEEGTMRASLETKYRLITMALILAIAAVAHSIYMVLQ